MSSVPKALALTDMYLPQLRIHVEIDEGQHFGSGGERLEGDVVRETDIINATGRDTAHYSRR